MGRRAGHWALRIGAAVLAAAALILAPAAFTAGGDNTILTAAGNGRRGTAGDGGLATEAALEQPRSVAATRDGGYVWAEPRSHRLRHVSAGGIVTTIAGTGEAEFSGDGGRATAAGLNFVQGASQMPDGGYVLADSLNHRIRRVSADGRIATVAGTGEENYYGDGGPATAAATNNPRGVAGLPDGGFLIPDTGNQRVRRVWPDGTITTVAGTGAQGFSGDGGPATAAMLSAPFGVAPTVDGSFLVVDIGNQRIRKVTPDGTIVTVAGNGTAGYSGDGGPATEASLNQPHNVAVLSDGGFLIADTGNHRIRRVGPDGRITTIAGTGLGGFRGDGKRATEARLNSPKGVAVLRGGSILVADEQNDRIRLIGTPARPVNTQRPTMEGSPAVGKTLRATSGDWRGYGVRFAYIWQRCSGAARSCVAIPGAKTASYVIGPADAGRRLRVKVTASTLSLSSSASSGVSRRVSGVVFFALPVEGSQSDGYVWRLETTSGATAAKADTRRDVVVVARSSTAKGVLASVGLLRFDTSFIPSGAHITSVKLQLQIVFAGSGDRLPLIVEPYPASRWPIGGDDFGGSSRLTSAAAVGLASLPREGTTLIPLRPEAIRRGSMTGLRLLVPGGSTETENAIAFASVDHKELAAPALVLRYSVGRKA